MSASPDFDFNAAAAVRDFRLRMYVVELEHDREFVANATVRILPRGRHCFGLVETDARSSVLPQSPPRTPVRYTQPSGKHILSYVETQDIAIEYVDLLIHFTSP